MAGPARHIKGRKPRQGSNVGVAQKPTIVLVGLKRDAAVVRQALRGLRARIDSASWEDLTIQDAARAEAVVAVHEPPGEPLPSALASLRAGAPAAALCALIPDEVGDTFVREVYQAGANAVFHWPRESLVLSSLLSELLGIRNVAGNATGTDDKVRRSVRAHLRLMEHGTSQLRLSVDDQVVHLRGTVRALWHVDEIRTAIGAVPGVVRVVVRDVLVNPRRQSDKSIRAAVDAIVERVIGDRHTVATSVSRGYITLSGHVESRSQKRRIRTLSTHVAGARGLRDSLLVAPKARKSDRVRARRIQAALATVFDQASVTATVFGQVLVLAGVVASSRERKEVGAWADTLEDVGHVVNKLTIEGGRH